MFGKRFQKHKIIHYLDKFLRGELQYWVECQFTNFETGTIIMGDV